MQCVKSLLFNNRRHKMEFTSKARRPFEFVDTYSCYYLSIVVQIFYMGIKFCDIQYLDWIVRYIVLRKATRFVSVWSIISIFSSSVEKKKKIYFILLEINATSCVITEWPPFLHKLLWALRRFWKKKPAFVFIIILLFIIIFVIIIIWRFTWVTFTKNVCEAKTAEVKKKSLNKIISL